MEKNNPLKQYFRQPANYIRLPSDGEYYPLGSIDFPENHEVAIYPMTARDEILLKTPDALLNGQAIIEIIRSCVPSVKEPWKMPAVDMDACLIAIRMATYGDNYDIDTSCPNCSEAWRFAIDLRTFLDQAQSYTWNGTIKVGALTFKIWPLTYEQVTKNQIKVLEEQRAISAITDSNLSDEEKVRYFGESFYKLTEINLRLVSECVQEVITPDGSVTDKEMIIEFFEQCDRETFTAVREHLDNLRSKDTIKPIRLKCQHCEHEYDKPVAFDESFFSAPNS